jgi:uroporphyrin-III C-methyltransferase / precorrin-2 dehydrogenase / sirohydrochlorin ferrochelatase
MKTVVPENPESSDAPRLFPAFLKLSGRAVALIGGGRVAVAKLPALLEAGARVRVVAPKVRPELERSDIEVRPREFIPEDLDDVWFAVAAAPAQVNRRVAAAAEARGIFVNAVDDPASGSAYTGGVFRRFGATIAISTEGRAPALAGLLREGLEYVIPEDLERWLIEARAVRQQQRAEGVPMRRRRPLLLAALNRLYAEKESTP